ncbi:MAG: alpha/beta fold hydrolase [Halioglobus sp.]|nr:alpha/beta fold hydrolase [Halioglobus sp.]
MVAKSTAGDRGARLDLYTRRSGEGPPVVLLHGLFGSGANLGALARSLRDGYTVLAPDLPGHGRSPPLVRYDLPGMAATLSAWLQREDVGSVHLVGHSLGGKIAMQLALEYPAQVRSLMVADIAPVSYPARHDAVFAGLAAVDAANCHSRDEADALLRREISDERVVQFLLGSLYRGDDGMYHWRMDVAGLQRDYAALSAAPGEVSAGHDKSGHASPGQARPGQFAPWPGEVLFVKGGASDYIRDAHRDAITALFPAAQVKVMPGCGHWLHVEKPQMFNGIVARFLEAQS